MRLAGGKATSRTPWTGTTRNMPKSGGRAGLIPSTAIRKMVRHLKSWIADLQEKKDLVVELVKCYLRTKTGVRDSTRAGYRTV